MAPSERLIEPAEAQGLGPDVVLAAANEIRRAVAVAWRFVGSEGLSRYLDRVGRDVARALPHAPQAVAIHVTDEERVASLALPSGTIVVSRGLLASLADEAELVFALGRELTHATVGAEAVASAGLRATASGESEDPWLMVAEDLVRLGHGAEREYAADAGGLDALAALGYDLDSGRRWLARLEERAAQGDAALAVAAAAHPPTADRLQRLRSHELDLGEVRRSGGRSNREVFRRAAGHTVLAYELRPLALAVAPREASRTTGRRPRIALAVTLAVALALGAVLLALRL